MKEICTVRGRIVLINGLPRSFSIRYGRIVSYSSLIAVIAVNMQCVCSLACTRLGRLAKSDQQRAKEHPGEDSWHTPIATAALKARLISAAELMVGHATVVSSAIAAAMDNGPTTTIREVTTASAGAAAATFMAP
jgi:hypothetical protein